MVWIVGSEVERELPLVAQEDPSAHDQEDGGPAQGEVRTRRRTRHIAGEDSQKPRGEQRLPSDEQTERNRAATPPDR